MKAAGQLDLPSPAGADQPGCYKSSASNTRLYVIWSTLESVCPVCEVITAKANILSCLNVDFAAIAVYGGRLATARKSPLSGRPNCLQVGIAGELDYAMIQA